MTGSRTDERLSTNAVLPTSSMNHVTPRPLRGEPIVAGEATKSPASTGSAGLGSHGMIFTQRKGPRRGGAGRGGVEEPFGTAGRLFLAVANPTTHPALLSTHLATSFTSAAAGHAFSSAKFERLERRTVPVEPESSGSYSHRAGHSSPLPDAPSEKNREGRDSSLRIRRCRPELREQILDIDGLDQDPVDPPGRPRLLGRLEVPPGDQRDPWSRVELSGL